MRRDTTPQEMLFDRRVVERNIRKGVVTREEYDTYLKARPDMAAQAETLHETASVEVAAGHDDDAEDSDDDEG